MPSVFLRIECFIGMEHNTEKHHALALPTSHVGGREEGPQYPSLKQIYLKDLQMLSQKNPQG